MRYDEIVTDEAVISRLPNAGRIRVRFHGFIVRWWLRALIVGDWDTVRHYSWIRRMRMANCETIRLGPIEIFRPMPWLLGPARQLHPEAFQ